MAKIIGGLATSHIPAIGGAIHKGKQQEPYWKPFFDGFPPVQNWLKETKPDVVIVTDDNPRSEDPAAIRKAIRAAAPDAIEVGDRAGDVVGLPAQAGDHDRVRRLELLGRHGLPRRPARARQQAERLDDPVVERRRVVRGHAEHAPGRWRRASIPGCSSPACCQTARRPPRSQRA